MDSGVSVVGSAATLILMTLFLAVVVGMWAGAIWQLVVWGWELVQV